MSEFDLLVVGAGLFGSVIAHEANKRGMKVLVVDRRDHIGGNCYTKSINEINVHVYGAHIFRTNDYDVWRYMEQFCEFNNFINSPVANYKGEIYNLPFNMNTFNKLWGVVTPKEAEEAIEKTRVINEAPSNLEEHVLNLVGRDIYEKLVKGYTEKQWGTSCADLPVSIMRRIPTRFIFDNNYFNDRWQGIPIGGYTAVFEKMMKGCEVRLNVDYLENRSELNSMAKAVVYTGTIDSFFDYKYGELGYRSLLFEQKILDEKNYQGVAVVNYTDRETPYTRIIEHKHFEFGDQPSTVISYEYPKDWHRGLEPYYPLEDRDNQDRYKQYEAEAKNIDNKIFFGGRLGEYRYYDMQDTIKSALKKMDEWFGSGNR